MNDVFFYLLEIASIVGSTPSIRNIFGQNFTNSPQVLSKWIVSGFSSISVMCLISKIENFGKGGGAED